MANFPASLPNFTVTAGSETANGAAGGLGLSDLLNSFEDEITAVATKIGTGASTPSAGKVLRASGTGTSTWGGVVMASDMAAFSSADIRGVVSDETGTGVLVFANAPTLSAPIIADFTAAQHNHSNAAGGGQLSASAFPNNAITAALLATNTIKLGSASISTTFNTSSSTAVQVTGLTSSVTIPAGSRDVLIVAFAPGLYDVGSGHAVMSIWDGTVGSGTQLSYRYGNAASGSSANGGICMALVPAPAAGSKTYNIGLNSDTGTANIEAGAAGAGKAFMIVVAI